MYVSKDVDKYLNYYIENIWFLGKLQISAIKRIAEYKGQGAEYISCSFNPDDEDFREKLTPGSRRAMIKAKKEVVFEKLWTRWT